MRGASLGGGWVTTSRPGGGRTPEQKNAAWRYRTAARIIDGTKVVAMIEDRLGTIRHDTISVRTLLIAFVMAVLDKRDWQISAAHGQLMLLPPELWGDDEAAAVRPARAYDGDVGDDRTREKYVKVWSYRSMCRRLQAIGDAFEVSQLHVARRNKKRRTPKQLTAEQAALNEKALQELCLEFLAGPLEQLSLASLSIDGTAMPAWVKQRTSTESLSDAFDADVSWHIRGEGVWRKSTLGYSAQVAVYYLPSGSTIVAGTDVRSGSTGEGSHGRELLDNIIDRYGQKVLGVVSDQVYSQAEDWHHHFRNKGVITHFQPSKYHGGIQSDAPGGALISTGNAYCPATPVDLIENVDRPPPGTPTNHRPENAEAWRSFFARQAERAAYLLKRNGRQRPDGSMREGCPARAGQVNCAHHAQPYDASLPTINNPPEHKPKVCAQGDIVIPGMIGKQPLVEAQYGSHEWFDAFSSERTRVEGLFGEIKYSPQYGLQKGRLRLTGRTRWNIVIALVCAIYNDSTFYAEAHNRQEYLETVWMVKPSQQAVLFAHQDDLEHEIDARAGPAMAA